MWVINLYFCTYFDVDCQTKERQCCSQVEKKLVFDNETICSASQFYRINCSWMTCWTNKLKSMNLDQGFLASG